jgi:hypothetical protein
MQICCNIELYGEIQSDLEEEAVIDEVNGWE